MRGHAGSNDVISASRKKTTHAAPVLTTQQSSRTPQQRGVLARQQRPSSSKAASFDISFEGACTPVQPERRLRLGASEVLYLIGTQAAMKVLSRRHRPSSVPWSFEVPVPLVLCPEHVCTTRTRSKPFDRTRNTVWCNLGATCLRSRIGRLFRRVGETCCSSRTVHRPPVRNDQSSQHGSWDSICVFGFPSQPYAPALITQLSMARASPVNLRTSRLKSFPFWLWKIGNRV